MNKCVNVVLGMFIADKKMEWLMPMDKNSPHKSINLMEVMMKKLSAVLVSIALLFSVAVVSPVWAGGGKVQHENGAETAPGPGDDAQGNQVGGDWLLIR